MNCAAAGTRTTSSYHNIRDGRVSSSKMREILGTKLDMKPYELLVGIPEKFKCLLCKQLLQDPVQTIRGNVACRKCYFRRESDPNFCPIDHEVIKPKSEVFPDKFKANEISKLDCYCRNKTYGCIWQGKIADIKAHLQECTRLPFQCTFCETKIPPECRFMEQHLKECNGIASHSVCIYAEYGCPFKVTAITEYISHLEGDTFLHCMMYYKHMKDWTQKAASLKNSAFNFRENAKVKVIEMNREGLMLSEKVNSLERSVEGLKMLFNQLRDKVNNSSMSNESDSTDKDNSSQTLLASKAAELNEEILRVDFNLILFENSSYNGTLLWKIDSFEDRHKNAVLGKTTALHSAPCLTARYGYKFCGRLYLNGDGMGKCTHLSLFLVIMKSPYDNLLQWPFDKHIRFRLLNQETIGNNLTEILLPDTLSSSYQKPVRDMNVATGCPMFVCKEKLMSDGYLKDDCIFIEISVL